jgi:hypothetical protein
MPTITVNQTRCTWRVVPQAMWELHPLKTVDLISLPLSMPQHWAQLRHLAS